MIYLYVGIYLNEILSHQPIYFSTIDFVNILCGLPCHQERNIRNDQS